ncbi:MAG: hypothetical protein ACRERU_02060 [Methylococcales bacterium]
MNTLIVAVYDEKLLRRKIRRIKIIPGEGLERGPDSPVLQEKFGGLSESDDQDCFDWAESPALME